MKTTQFTWVAFLLVALSLPKMSFSDGPDDIVGVESATLGWHYTKVAATADLIVVATLRSSESGQHHLYRGDLRHEKYFNESIDVIESRFDVAAVLKGATDRQVIDVIHVAWKEGVVVLSGPPFASFTTEMKLPVFVTVEIGGEPRAVSKPTDFYTLKPEYLLFLERRDDARYQLVSGDIHGRSSVRILNLD